MKIKRTFGISFFFYAYLLMISGCQQELLEELTVYTNDFSSPNLVGILSDEGISDFNGNNVLGFFNNQGFSLKINDLPKHNMVRIDILLYIHNFWNGNSIGIEGPDIWKMMVNNTEIINTTFSNSVCASTYCLHQSYPENSLRQFPPKTGALNTNLPGNFDQENNLGWTTSYHLSKIIPHTERFLLLECFDELRQLNVENHLHDESWSVGKVEINILNVK